MACLQPCCRKAVGVGLSHCLLCSSQREHPGPLAVLSLWDLGELEQAAKVGPVTYHSVVAGCSLTGDEMWGAGVVAAVVAAAVATAARYSNRAQANIVAGDTLARAVAGGAPIVA